MMAAEIPAPTEDCPTRVIARYHLPARYAALAAQRGYIVRKGAAGVPLDCKLPPAAARDCPGIGPAQGVSA